MATVILTSGPLPRTYAAGTWPLNTFNTGRYHFVWTPVDASTAGAWGGGAFRALLVAQDLGGIWMNERKLEIYDQAQAILLSVTLAWDAGTPIDLLFDFVARTVTISGPSTGSGVHPIAAGGAVFTNVTLGLGVYGGNNNFFLSPSTISDIDDANDGPTAVIGTLTTTLGAAIISSSGTVVTPPAPGGLTTTLGPVIVTSGGAARVGGTLAKTLDAVAIESTPPVAFAVGVGAAEQELNAVSHGGPFTKSTPSTDVVIASVAGNVLTATAAHGMKKGDGPYPFATTGTLPGGLTPGVGYYVCDIGASTFGAASTGINAIANTEIALSGSGTGTHTLVRTVDTQPTGSLFLVFETKGQWNAAPSAIPTDNKGNTYTQLGTTHFYSQFTTSATAVFYSFGIGGVDHSWSIQGADFDEITVSALEIKGAKLIQAHSHVERPIGSATITSLPVTTTGPAILVAVCFGNGPVNQDHTFTPEAGWTKVPAASREADMSANGYIQVTVAYRQVTNAGSYTVSWQGTNNEGAQLYLIAVQAEEGWTGALTEALNPITIAAQGTVTAATSTGALVKTLAPATVTSTAAARVGGSMVENLSPASLVSDADIVARGSLSTTLGSSTSPASGTARIAGGTSKTLGLVSVQATGTADEEITGQMAVTMAPMIVTTSGVAANRGNLSEALAGVTLSSAGAVGLSSTGTMNVTLEPTTVVSFGAISGNVPSFGPPVNNIRPARFGASDYLVDSSLSLGDYILPSAWWLGTMVKPASLGGPAALEPQDDIMIIGDDQGGLGIAMNASGVRAWSYDGSTKVTDHVSISADTWVWIEAWMFGGTLAISVNNGPPKVVLGVGNLPDLSTRQLRVGRSFVGDVMEIMVAEDRPVSLLAYLQKQYPNAGLVP